MLLVMLQAGRAAGRAEPPTASRIAIWYAAVIVAATSFGTGLAFALALPVVLAILLPRWHPAWRSRLPLVSLYTVMPLLYFGLNHLSGVVFQQPLLAATLYGTQLMLGTWRRLPAGLAHLTGFGLFRLVWNGPLPRSVFPAAYVLLGALVAGVGAIAWRDGDGRRRTIVAFGVLTLAC